jgi:Nucleotidyltransferase substrate binding protein like
MRQAFASGYIDDAQIWMDMIDTRNAFSHDYDGNFFHEKESFLRNEAFQAIERLHIFFISRI